jgi:hypothetical protein
VQIIVAVADRRGGHFSPAPTAAFALALSDEKEVTGRVTRNETFTLGGNVAFAAIAVAAGTAISLVIIFYSAAIFATGVGIATRFIREESASFEAARRGDEGEKNQPKGYHGLFRDKRILFFTLAVVLFNVSNAATLPLIAKLFFKDRKRWGSAWQVAAARNECDSGWDIQMEITELPRAFRTGIDTVPASILSLTVPDEHMAGACSIIGPRQSSRVGICWTAGA